MVEMLQQYCDRLARYSTAGYSVVIRNIIHYINLHLKEDLTLSTPAARFNLSRSYLSDRLHREVHSNLTDYVTLTQEKCDIGGVEGDQMEGEKDDNEW